jgi:hypothetical protein
VIRMDISADHATRTALWPNKILCYLIPGPVLVGAVWLGLRQAFVLPQASNLSASPLSFASCSDRRALNRPALTYGT